LVKNFNGPLNLGITLEDNARVSPLQLQVQNSHALTSVSLDSDYQGSFSVQSKMSQVTVKDTAPLLRDKQARTLVYDQHFTACASGWVGWGLRPMARPRAVQSCVEIVSALSPVTLIFGPG